MDKVLPGARDLGLTVRWRFAFVGPGSTATTTRDAVYLDVGNQVAPGVLDTHDGSAGVGSTAQLIVARPDLVHAHLLGPWLDRRDEGVELSGRVFSPVVVTHLHPDLDAVVATLLVQWLVEHGDLPAWAGPLANYASQVDQGKVRLPADQLALSLHAAFLGVQNLPAPEGEAPHRSRLERGLELFRRAVEAGGGFLPPGCAAWRDDPDFADVRALVDVDRARWEEDDGERSEVELPAEGGGTLSVPALFLQRPTASRLNKYWARAEGAVLLCCPYGEGAEGVFPRVIVSLDPTWQRDGRRPTLRGLGQALERAETEVQPDRPGPPRYDDGTCEVADPWYDGRGHDYTIVDAPRSGTRLPYDRVWSVVCSRFWDPPLRGARVLAVRAAEGVASAGRPAWVDPLSALLGDVGVGETGAGRWAVRAPDTEMVAVEVTEVHFVGDLSEVERWLEEFLAGDLRAHARLELDLVHATWPVEAVAKRLAGLLGGRSALAPNVDHHDRGVVVVHGPVRAEPDADAAFVYLAAARLTVDHFAERAREAVGAHRRRGRLRGGVSARLRGRFLQFRGQGLHLAAPPGARWPAEAAAYADLLGLEARSDHTARALEELSAIEAELSEKVLESLLALLGVTGMTQTVMAFYTLPGDLLASGRLWLPLVSGTLIPFLAILLLVWRRRG